MHNSRDSSGDIIWDEKIMTRLAGSNMIVTHQFIGKLETVMDEAESNQMKPAKSNAKAPSISLLDNCRDLSLSLFCGMCGLLSLSPLFAALDQQGSSWIIPQLLVASFFMSALSGYFACRRCFGPRHYTGMCHLMLFICVVFLITMSFTAVSQSFSGLMRVTQSTE